MSTLPESGQSAALSRLGEFLRSRRKLLAPVRAAAPFRRRSRTEGMRREEVATRAGISADWYARIEMGNGAVPSVPTLHAIAKALELNALDTRYLFEIAELPVPRLVLEPHSSSLTALEHAILDMSATAGVIFDLFASPLCWNATADGMFRWSAHAGAFERNGIVAGLADPYYAVFFGQDFEEVARRTIGLFRRAYTIAPPPPLAQRVYEFGMTQPLFVRMWNENSVADDMSPPAPFVRTVPEIGKLRLDVNDVLPHRRNDLIVRFLAPHDDETRAKFPLLAARGTPGRLKPLET